MTAATNHNPQPSKSGLVKQLMALGLTVAFCILYLIFGGITGIYIPCVFRKITHWYCPGCGITRMFAAILAGDFYQAMRYNPLLFILLPVALLYLVDSLISRMRGRKSLLTRTPGWIWILMIAILIGYGVMRNLSWFGYLAPTEV